MEDGERSRSPSSADSRPASGSRSRSEGSRSRSRSSSRRRRSRDRSRERSRGRARSRARVRSRGSVSCDDSEESSVAVAEEARLLMESGVVKLCADHGADLVPVDCVSCRMVSRTVRAPVLTEFIRLSKGKSVMAAQIPGAASRFATRIDEKTPTLTFTEQDMALASSLFSRGKMAPATMFDELTREYLFLPQGQNESLTKSVQLEQFLLKYKSYTNVFQFVEQMAKVAKHLRISERPIILATASIWVSCILARGPACSCWVLENSMIS